MNKTILQCAALFLIVGCVAVGLLFVLQQSPGDQILTEINEVKLPKQPGEKAPPEEVQDFKAKQRKAFEKRAALVGELRKVDPDHPDLPQLLPIRWIILQDMPALASEFKAELDQVRARSKDRALVAEAAFQDAILSLKMLARGKPEEVIAVVKQYSDAYPSDGRLPEAMMSLADKFEDPDSKEALYGWIEQRYQNTASFQQAMIARMNLQNERKMRERVGKPFVVEFNDVLTGRKVSTADLKGKVIVVDFWATWCVPCVQEMPNLKKLYDQYKDKGVEFVGISLDHPVEMGGLDKLKTFLAANEIRWPQYYLGNGWESEFSMSWGVMAIPRAFLIDAEGNLAETQARDELESMIPKYLEKSRKPQVAGR